MDPFTLINADCLTALRTLPAESVQCCVTSPPYFGLRDYGHPGQIGLEQTPADYVAKMVEVFDEVRRVLRADGTLWLNLGDSYAGSWGAQSRGNETPGTLEGSSMLSARQIKAHPKGTHTGSLKNTPGLKNKDLIGIPWRVAFALQAAGWWLREDIIWAKKSCMPESVTDRCTRSHEYIFHLSKSASYYHNAKAIAEPSVDPVGAARRYETAFVGDKSKAPVGEAGIDLRTRPTGMRKFSGTRNKRSVWTVGPANFPGAHFATFPPDLIKPCILAGAGTGDVVIDPFAGSGTTGMVALELGRKALMIELNPDYCALIRQRCAITPGLALSA